MPRETTVTLAGEEIILTANFANSMKIAKEVGDPILIMREASLEAYFLANNMPYEPKFKLTLDAVVAILAIGSGKTKSEIGELVFNHGLLLAKEIAAQYILSIVGPTPEVELENTESGTTSPEK